MSEVERVRSPKAKGKNAKKPLLIAGIAVVAALVVFAFTFGFVMVSGNDGDLIHRGITIDGTAVGELTYDQAVSAVKLEKDKTLTNIVDLVKDEESTKAAFDEFELQFGIEEAVQKAMDYGKKGNVFSRFGSNFSLLFGEKDFPVELTIADASVEAYAEKYIQAKGSSIVENSYSIENNKLKLQNGAAGKGIDKEALIQDIKAVLETEESGTVQVQIAEIQPSPWDVDKVYEEICTPPVNASYETKNGKSYFVAAKVGYSFDKDALKKLLEENKGNTKPFTLDLKVIEPEVKYADATGLFKEVISSYSSVINSPGDTNRVTNLKLACAAINGTVINPGDVFSYNKTLGPVTAATGYKNATIFTAKGMEPGIGGGICQVSSAMYCAALYGNFEIVKRINHMYVVGYVPIGQDATVYEGEVDFRFRNNTEEPIKILASVSGGKVNITIYGKKPDPSISVKIENITVNVLHPETIVKEDPSLAPGQKKVSVAGVKGYIVDTYKYVYKGDALQSKTFLHRSKYIPINRVELHGAGPAPQEPTPVPTQAPTQAPPVETPPPTQQPTPEPTQQPTPEPTPVPTQQPTQAPPTETPASGEEYEGL